MASLGRRNRLLPEDGTVEGLTGWGQRGCRGSQRCSPFSSLANLELNGSIWNILW